MKILALHLPQYHRIKENDLWWGEGFTDWVNVKKAKPLFKNHQQPLIPLNENYYDMTNVNTLIWQAKISKSYGIYGFCYYHYWFKGKKLLEKPCEILLEHPEIDQNYCFCWANETWSKTWDGKEKDILIKQEYGGISDWDEHFLYLSNFFRDSRYIKVNNKPVIFIYSCDRLYKVDEMIAYWRQKAIENGFNGLYIAEFINTFNSGYNRHDTDVVVEFEPLYTARYSVSNWCKFKRLLRKKTGYIDYLDYDYIWNCLLNNNRDYNKKVLRSAFVNFDNSPRKKNRSTVILDSNPKKFKKYINVLFNKSDRNYDDEFCVINAWNEWAEGAVLEPSEQYKYEYLSVLQEIIK